MSKTYIQLGRTGDIINLLPFLYHDAQAGKRESLMVASEFSGVLDGVSYVDPVIFEGSYAALDHAVAQCKKQGRDWISTQVNGPIEHIKEFTYKPAHQTQAVCTSFQKESWRVAGRLKEWDKRYPLVFDRRDKAREAALVEKVLGPSKKRKKRKLLVAMSGVSSPFKANMLLDELIKLKFAKSIQVVDLTKVRAERIYDLLGLYEEASLLIATDSAPLHLARAFTDLPVIALANDQPLLWHGSSWDPQHVIYCRYSDFQRRFMEILDAIERYCRPRLPPLAQGPAVIHVYNNYEGFVAAREYEPNWKELPIQIGSCGRDSFNTIGDPLRVPYLKDCLRMGLQSARAGDYVVVTRHDVFFKNGITREITAQPACYSYRLENGNYVPICDVFAASKDWWEKQLVNIPDFLLGRDHLWAHGLWAIFNKNGARMLTGFNYRQKNERTAETAT